MRSTSGNHRETNSPRVNLHKPKKSKIAHHLAHIDWGDLPAVSYAAILCEDQQGRQENFSIVYTIPLEFAQTTVSFAAKRKQILAFRM